LPDDEKAVAMASDAGGVRTCDVIVGESVAATVRVGLVDDAGVVVGDGVAVIRVERLAGTSTSRVVLHEN
jgi:hypothetical protein